MAVREACAWRVSTTSSMPWRRRFAAEGLTGLHLAGHSLGGAVAIALAARAGIEARSLFAVAPAGLGPETNGDFIAGFLRARSKASLKPWLDLLAHDPASLGPSFLDATWRQREADDGVVAAMGKRGGGRISRWHPGLQRAPSPRRARHAGEGRVRGGGIASSRRSTPMACQARWRPISSRASATCRFRGARDSGAAGGGSDAGGVSYRFSFSRFAEKVASA